MIALSVSVRRGLIMGAYLAVLAALYLAPLGLDSPCIKEKGALGPAPALIGHRGAPMVSSVLSGRSTDCTGPLIRSTGRLRSPELDQAETFR